MTSPKTDPSSNNKITIKLIWEIEIEPKQLLPILLPLLMAGWFAFQAFIHSTPIVPITTPTVVQIDQASAN